MLPRQASKIGVGTARFGSVMTQPFTSPNPLAVGNLQPPTLPVVSPFFFQPPHESVLSKAIIGGLNLIDTRYSPLDIYSPL